MNDSRQRFVVAVCLIPIAVVFASFPRGEQAESTNDDVPRAPLATAKNTNDTKADDGESGSEWDSADVIVVGAGISGLTAALELSRGGANVTVIDMSSVFGGHAVMSQGGVCIVDTPFQKSVGIQDSAELAYGDFIRWGEDADAAWVRYYVDHSREEIFDWLTELGVPFSNIDTAPGNSVDRFHQPAGRGIGLVTPIYRACLDRPNVSFIWNAKAEQLLTEDSRVVGVLVKDVRTEEELELRAPAVVLATGGFQSNLDMVREYWPAEFRFPDRILVGSGRHSVGHGHKLAQRVGADLVKMDHQWNYFTGIPDPRYPGTNRGLSAANMYGIIVNPDGHRFANLHNWAKEVMPRLLKQERATLWFVFDEAIKPFFVVSGTDWADFKKVDKVILQNPKLVKSADSIEELAEKSGLPAANLKQTIQRYNELLEQGEDKDFGRFGPGKSDYSKKASRKIGTPPYYAMQAYPLTRKSMGGVAIDLNCRVIDKQRKPIPGLYAVGELTGLAGINGKAALEGTFLGPCIVTGRVAGRSLLKELKTPSAKVPDEAVRCAACHDMKSMLAERRRGYWHFEKVHRVSSERRLDCRQCHAELAPYRADSHRISPQVLTTTCILCHIAQE